MLNTFSSAGRRKLRKVILQDIKDKKFYLHHFYPYFDKVSTHKKDWNFSTKYIDKVSFCKIFFFHSEFNSLSPLPPKKRSPRYTNQTCKFFFQVSSIVTHNTKLGILYI